MYKLIFFVPENDAEKVKSAVFSTGAGKLGTYENCSWQTLGVGQFKPLPGSAPSIGKVDVLEKVNELRIEILCDKGLIGLAIDALKSTHPYEEPAYEVIQLVDL